MSCISLENFKKRLKALEEKVARYGIELTDSQIAALERKASDDESCGEIETAHPGYPGSQDTFHVGNLKGVGRIYQQTFVDCVVKASTDYYLWCVLLPAGGSVMSLHKLFIS